VTNRTAVAESRHLPSDGAPRNALLQRTKRVAVAAGTGWPSRPCTTANGHTATGWEHDQTIVSLPHSRASHLSTWQDVRWVGKFGSRRPSIRSSLPWPHHLHLDRLSWVPSLAATASSFPTTFTVVARRDALNGYKVDLVHMTGCNHWVGDGQQEG